MRRVIKTPDESVIRSVLQFYERGQTVDALRMAEGFAPLSQWGGASPCVLAARIATNAGAPRLATQLTIRARRSDPQSAEALAQYGYELSNRRGSLALWQLLRNREDREDTVAECRAELLTLHGMAASNLRDFSTAERLIARAESLDPERPWIRLQRAYLLEHLDRPEEALEVANDARKMHPHPFYRPAVQASAQLLQLLDRDADAIQLLSEANAALQSGLVAAQLFALLSENGRWSEAAAALERYVELSPMLERPLQNWVASQRARGAYHLGKRMDAARFAATLEDDFHKKFAARLGVTPAGRERVQLNVTFVRQHFKTCAPATLAALGRFWRMPVEHLKLAEAMCYDGTPHWQQRQWAEGNGWFVREFRVTHESAVTLIEKGIPFAIAVVDATSAHMMAFVGFDRARGTLLLRDPGQPYIVEMIAEEFLKRYGPFGPHGTVFLPVAEKTRLDGVALPDTEIYDEYHRFWIALAKHDRAAAAEIFDRMESSFSSHMLVWEARLDLASYDANNAEQARCLDKLLELFPNNPARLLRRLGCLRDAPRDERIKFLEQACAAKEADPVLFVELARAMEGDARALPRARQWLKRAKRFRPMDSNTISVQADLDWEDGKLEAATELCCFAATLEGFREHLYQAWFRACRGTCRTDEAMAHLQDRFTRFGSRSEQPALTLAWAWREMEQPTRAREVLAEAVRLRPEDGYLLLRSATLVANLGEAAEAERLLNATRTKVRENDWLRAAAEIAENQLDTATALKWAREILEREPLALDAHGGVARALAQLEGRAAAMTHLKGACARFPHHYGLQRMLVDWSRDSGPEVVEAAARELLRVEPADAWTRRELAMALTKLQRNEEALREAEEALRIEPRNSYSFSILGHVHRQREQLTEARRQFRQAVEVSVDNDDALRALLALARTDKERKEELTFIEQQLIRQVVTGDGLLAFLELARPVLEPEILLRSLQQAHSARPDLWHAWAALISQLGHLNRLDEALAIAKQQAERFPHLPRTWLDLAFTHQCRNEPEGEITAAQRAFDMNPAWARSTLALADAFERQGKLHNARRVYERALLHSANDAQLHACHALLLWRLRQKEAAFAAVERALRLAPGYEWAWELLQSWSGDCGETRRAGEFARVLANERPGELRVWLMLARVLHEPATMPERLAAVERALELDGRSAEAWDLKAELLTTAERFDDAIKACTDGAAVCTLDVHILRGRHAWVEARRRQLPEAIRLMRALLAENASYVWGWNQLAHWLAEQGSTADATAALEQLVRLRPHDAWVNRQLGFLRLKQDDRAGAQKAFAAALQLAPTDVAAAQNLFDLQLQASDLTGASATLRVMQTHQPGASTLASEIFLLLRRNDKAAAIKVLEKLCKSPDPDPWPADAAADAFKNAGQSSAALKVFKRALKRDSCNPQVGAAAIRLLFARRSDARSVWWFMRFKPGEIQRRAAAPLVGGLAELKSKFLLRCLLWRRREVLALEDAAWGQVGYALSNFNRMKEVARWLADWRTRRDVQPWMLFNYCLALRHLGRYDEANEVARHVLETWGHREGSADMRLFLAVEDALAGLIPSAQQHLQRIVVREGVAHDQELLALAKALVEFQQVPSAERPRQFKAIRRQLGECFSAWRLVHVMKDVRRTFRRAGKVFVHNGGGSPARLWFGWKLNWQWLLLPAAPVLLALAVQPPVLLGLLIWRFSRRLKN
jgi:tetratricopeptide (TPR) repeat protein